jgi:cyclopropane fatty-acyl-phospholipid synthase-like methyltransferase
MGNKNIIEYYNKMAQKITDAKATRNNAKDFSQYDIQLMETMADKNKTLLDLGSGTGLLINHLIDDFKMITAVEKYPEFSKFITKSPKIKIINDDLLKLSLHDNTKYDIISLFGVMNYFDFNEASFLYKKIVNYLKTDGTLVIKNQFGVNEDVIVNGYSEELKTNYYSEYRHIEKEKKLLDKTGFKNIETIDIYPPEYNRWDNTHFYALICRF